MAGSRGLSPPPVQRFLKQSAQLAAMARCVWPFLLALVAAVSLAGCGFFSRPERPIWRTQAENACFARKLVTLSDYIVPTHEIDGPGICGMTRPLKVSALADGKVLVDKVLTIDCPMIPALEAWLNDVVQPDAQARFGQKVATLNVFGAYSCRPIDNMPGDRLSEHAFGNAVDVAGFTLADGRTIEFVRDWKKDGAQEAAFLHETHAGACQYFTTVLGPGADVFHYNHIHLDLANHGATDTGPRRICKPAPAPSLLPPPAAPDGLPPAPEIEEPLDIAHLGNPHAVGLAPMSLTGPTEGPDGALPPAAVGETDPAPPILPAGVGPAVDVEPTSSIGDHDD
jgi:hypothetical protein